MTVYRNKQRDGEWRYDFWRKKKRYFDECIYPETGLPAANKREAEAAEKVAKGEAEKESSKPGRSNVPVSRYSFAQAVAAHIKRLVERKRNLAHIENNRLYCAEILGFFGVDKAFRDLTQDGHDGIDAYASFARGQTHKVWLGGPRSRTDADLANPTKWRETGRPRSIRTSNNYLKCLKSLMARAAKVRDPFTKEPAVDPALEVELEKPPKRLPRPMSDQELHERADTLTPWGKEGVGLSRYFGLRLDEALRLEERHADPSIDGLFFPGEETKSGHDERVFGGEVGWRLVQKLIKQARKRKTTFLVTWPGAAHVHLVVAGKPAPDAKWMPLKSLGTSWRKSGKRAGIMAPRRFHDVRARAISEVAKVMKAAAQGFARHQSPATTALYIAISDEELSQVAAEAASRRPDRKARRPKLRVVK